MAKNGLKKWAKMADFDVIPDYSFISQRAVRKWLKMG